MFPKKASRSTLKKKRLSQIRQHLVNMRMSNKFGRVQMKNWGKQNNNLGCTKNNMLYYSVYQSDNLFFLVLCCGVVDVIVIVKVCGNTKLRKSLNELGWFWKEPLVLTRPLTSMIWSSSGDCDYMALSQTFTLMVFPPCKVSNPDFIVDTIIMYSLFSFCLFYRLRKVRPELRVRQEKVWHGPILGVSR